MIRAMSLVIESDRSLEATLKLSEGVLSGLRRPAGPVPSVRGDLFLKPVAALELATAEADGLGALASADFRIPETVGVARLAGGRACLLLEWLPLSPLPSSACDRLAEQLCRWHQAAPAEGFGWHRNNYIGTTPQSNQAHAHWHGFFLEQRLRPQLSLAQAALSPALIERVERVMEALPALLDGALSPTRVHGDLWRGNLAWSEGQPAMYDPAVYQGSPEVDLAMLELFGEPVTGLLQACQRYYALDEGFALRKHVYHLYHFLNHFNMFGQEWVSSVALACDRILGEVRA